MDKQTLCSELMRALRGHRSQVQFSRRLGYSSNVAYTWESGSRWPTATTLVHAARRVGVDVEGGIRRFHRDPSFLDAHDFGSVPGIAAFLTDLKRDRPLTAIAESSGASRFQVSRWLKGQADPRLPELLRLVDALSGRLLDFIAVFVDPAELPCAAESWSRLEAARSLFWRHPQAQVVLLALELADYTALPAHDDIWLSRRLGIPLYEVVDLLHRLASTGQIAMSGNHWSPAEVRTVDTRRHPEAGDALQRWWWDTAAEHLSDPDSSVSFNAFAVSDPERHAIIEVYRTAYRQMRAIVSASEGGGNLVLVQSALVNLSHPI